MNDADFMRALKSCSLPAGKFDHAAHVRAAYLCLRQGDFGLGLQRLRLAIRKYSSSLGNPERYHETVTVAFASLIQQHLVERGNAGGWLNFARQNPELFERDLLLRFYTAEELSSPLAQRTFLLPHTHRLAARRSAS